MADASGTPTSPDNIPTYNTAADNPSGKGFNTAMAAIQTALITRLKLTGSPSVTGQVPVWNNSLSQWVPGTAGPGAPVTTLPASPADGQQAVLTDSTSAPTYEWLMQWSTAASKWLFVGGSAARVAIDTDEIVTGNTYIDAPTVGPSFTVPRTGSYVIDMGVSPYADSTTATPFATIKLGAAAANDNESIGCVIPTINAGVGSFTRRYTRSLTAADLIKMQYRGNGVGNNHFRFRWLSVQPVSVS